LIKPKVILCVECEVHEFGRLLKDEVRGVGATIAAGPATVVQLIAATTGRSNLVQHRATSGPHQRRRVARRHSDARRVGAG